MAANITKRETIITYLLKMVHNTICEVFTHTHRHTQMEPESSDILDLIFSLQEIRGSRSILHNSLEIKLAKSRQWETMQDK